MRLQRQSVESRAARRRWRRAPQESGVARRWGRTVRAWAAASVLAGGSLVAAHSGGRAPLPPLHKASDAMDIGNFSHTVVAAAPTPDGKGFWLAYADGSVVAVGDATYYGDMAGHAMNAPVVNIAATPDGHGYWLLGADGGVFTFGDAAYEGSTGNIHLNAPALQMAAEKVGQGYYFVAGDGGVFTFGDTPFYGSTGNIRLNQPMVGMAGTPDGHGYWLVAADGGVFTFGDAPFYGSTGSTHLNRPVVAMAPTSDGHGYWLLAADGGVFTFGDAHFYGAAVGMTGSAIPVGLIATGDGGGYWIPLSDGQILNFGDAPAVSSTTASSGGPPPPDSRYAFELVGSNGKPARWNPCETIPYAVVWPGAPAGWQSDVSDAISQVAKATGLNFVLAGYYSSSSGVTAPLVIDWSSTINGGDVVGLTTYWYYDLSGYNAQIVQARIDLKEGLPAGFGTTGEGPVLLHELGHATGLAHVPGQPEIMNPYDQGYPTYQLGDLNGLWQVGAAGGCSGFYK